MKYHIDTIPVWDALRQGGECPLCITARNSEKSYIDSFLGASVMEPDTRIEVNKNGFCPHHFSMLFAAQNRLGLALITHTYLKETKKAFEQMSKRLQKNMQPKGKSPIASLFSKEGQGDTDEFVSFVKTQQESCIICDRLQNALARYAYTILHLWRTDTEFKALLMSSDGFCLPHFATTITIAQETIDARRLSQWITDIIPLEINALNKLDDELYWFTQKFDYRNQDKPWGNSKDALPRTLQKFIGRIIE